MNRVWARKLLTVRLSSNASHLRRIIIALIFPFYKNPVNSQVGGSPIHTHIYIANVSVFMYLYDKLINKIFTNIIHSFFLWYLCWQSFGMNDVTTYDLQVRIFCNNMNNLSLTYMYKNNYRYYCFSPRINKIYIFENPKRNFALKNHNLKKSYRRSNFSQIIIVFT